MYVFILAASDPTALQTFCDTQLNAPMGAPDRFRVLAPLVMLTITQTDAITSEVPPFSDQGALFEREATFWIPIRDTAGPLLQPLSFFTPYIFVDNPLALVAGRELYGFPKDPADVTMPADPTQPGGFAVNGLTVQTFGPQATVTRATLVSVAAPASPQPGGIIADAAAAFAAIRTIFEGLGNLARDLHEALALLSALEHHALQTVLLKQVRDTTNGLLACYQAVVQVPLEVTRFEGFRHLEPHVVTLASTASDPLPASLGLSAMQTSLAAFWLRFDSRLPEGEVLWQA